MLAREREENDIFKLKEENAKIINEIFDAYDKKEAIKNLTNKFNGQLSGLDLQHVKNYESQNRQNYAIVQINGMALQYIKNQTEEICKLAVQQNIDSYIYISIDIYNNIKELS